MQFRLRTLMLLTAVAPPAMAVLWFGWREILALTLLVALIAIWFGVSIGLARFFARLIASVMD